MIGIFKIDKPQTFLELYARANPLPGARAKVPLLEVRKDGGGSDNCTVVLCESLTLAEYVAELSYASSCDGNPRRTLLPPQPEDRAVLHLFQELCGSTFSYLSILRAHSLHHLETEQMQLQDRLVNLNAFLSSAGGSRTVDISLAGGPFLYGNQFTLAECNLAPFLQRCCSILPNREELAHLELPLSSSLGALHPLAICSDLGLVRLDQWINAVLSRDSVQKTGPPSEEMINKKDKFLKRLLRLNKKASGKDNSSNDSLPTRF